MTLTTADLPAGSVADDGAVSPRAERPRRRVFTAEYKLQFLAEYEAAEPGQRGALLRREGLYSSHLVEWRRARDAGALAGLAVQPRAGRRTPEQVELERLRREKAKVEAELARTKAALDVVGKAHALLELLSESADSETRSKK